MTDYKTIKGIQRDRQLLDRVGILAQNTHFQTDAILQIWSEEAAINRITLTKGNTLDYIL